MIGRLIGVDHGQKRIGLAISDALGLSARELAILRSRGETEDFAAILAVAEREEGGRHRGRPAAKSQRAAGH